jgi:hypothetical protein
MAPSDRRTLRRRLAWFAGSLVLLAALAAAFWFSRPSPPAPAPDPVAQAPAAPPPPAPLVRADLGLPELAAAVDAALQPPLQGAPPPQVMGRRFTIALAFGCSGPLAEGAEAALGYTLDPRQGAITLIARPEGWTDSALVRSISSAGAYEAVEGFWVQPNPAAAQGCAAPPAAETDARIGLARFFPAGGSRAEQRRDRPYRVTRKVDAPAAAFPQGFRLVLSGRIADWDDGPVIRCGAPASAAAPECLVAVEFDQVAFEDAATGEVLARWGA